LKLGGDGGKQVVKGHNTGERTLAVNDRRPAHSASIHRIDAFGKAHVDPQAERIAGHYVPNREAMEVGTFGNLAAHDVAIGEHSPRCSIAGIVSQQSQRER